MNSLARRATAVLISLTVQALASCASEHLPVTQLLCDVTADAEVGAALEKIVVKLYPADASEADKPRRTQRFLLTQGKPSAGEVRLPFSFGIAKGKNERVRLVVEGYDSRSDNAEPVIERKIIARFAAGETTRVEIVLSAACYDKATHCEALDRTCAPASDDGVVAGECVSAGDAPAASDPQETSDAGPPKVDASTTGQDTAMMPAAMMPAANPPPANPPSTKDICAEQNSCASPDYPCAGSGTGGYTCRGQFADWPMPDVAPGAKFAPSYDYASTPGVVKDKVTGLEWQRRPPATYAGCSGKAEIQGDTCTLTEAKRYCAQLNLEGSGWRLPSKIELESIIGDTRNAPALDFAAFPDSSTDAWFWAASPATPEKGAGWRVHFGFGSSLPEPGDNPHSARCVRGGARAAGKTPADRYQLDSAKDAVTDTRTQLVWRRTIGDSNTWDAAKKYCAGLGEGWRLPTLKELLTLVDPTQLEPAIDPVFPGIPLGGMFWTTSQFYGDDTQAYVVDFAAGFSGASEQIRGLQTSIRITFHARCVR